MSDSRTVSTKAGEVVNLERLTVADIVGLQEQEYEIQRKRLMRDMDDAGLEPKERGEHLRNLARLRDLGSDLIRSCWTPRGASNVIGRALTNGVTFDDLDLDISNEAVYLLALDLIGVSQEDIRQQLDSKAKGSDPSQPQGTGT